MPASQLVVNVEATETRVALVEEGALTELHVERAGRASLLGNIYHGTVSRVVRGMQACFVDIGLGRHAFLQVGDALRGEELEALAGDGPSADEAVAGKRVSRSTPIAEVLRAGQPVVVQISREPMGHKGPRVTSHVSLPGRTLVFLPTLDQIGVSRRIVDEQERKRLRGIVEELRSVGGFIVRTAAEGAAAEELAAEVNHLTATWAAVLDRRAEHSPPALLHEDLDLATRAARDLFSDSVETLVVDDRGTFERVRRFVSDLMPARLGSVRHFQGPEPVFEAFGIEEKVRRALARVISLPSGGSLVIDHAEALTAIDVNTGSYAGGKDLEDTITRTNLEAVREVAYQLRLRNIGGLIVVDFIDMDRPENREKVNRALLEALKEDRMQTTAVQISELGLVEMTRKGARQSLARQLYEPCPYCDGTGQLKSGATVACEIVRALRRSLSEAGAGATIVETHPKVAELLSADHGAALRDLESRHGRTIEVRGRDGLHPERYEIKGG